jgi:hypothetical protein
MCEKLLLMKNRGHYDILYKLEDLPARVPLQPPSTNQDIFVGLSHGQTEHIHTRLPFAVNDFEIPGMSVFPSPALSSPVSWSSYAQFDFPQATGPTMSLPSHVRTLPSTPAATYQVPPDAIDQAYFSSPNVSIQQLPTVSIQQLPTLAPATPVSPVLPSSPAHAHLATLQSGTPFRPSRWEYETSIALGLNPPLCQTAIFKK